MDIPGGLFFQTGAYRLPMRPCQSVDGLQIRDHEALILILMFANDKRGTASRNN
jgi:hypothetical protein